MRLREHEQAELSHYSKGTTDIEFLFPFGWGELWGIADRTDFDLRSHAEHSGESFEYLDPFNGKRYIPYCVEPSLGADPRGARLPVRRVRRGGARRRRRAHGAAPAWRARAVQGGVLPLSKKLAEPAKALHAQLARRYMVDYDETGSIGKRYPPRG